MSPASASAALVTGWDRLAVIVLGGAGCALSASALIQTAIAIHIRPSLCWLFPLVVDGFIAYGIRALLVLRTAPLRARLYVWALVGTATAVSVWANALHAVRLNETAPGGGLQLGDTVVAYLSTVAPLALAGAVHLYILIARGPGHRGDGTDEQFRSHLGQAARAEDTTGAPADRAGQQPPHPGQPVTPTAPAARPLTNSDTLPVPGHHTGQRGDTAASVGQPYRHLPVSDRRAANGPGEARPFSRPLDTDRPLTHMPATDRASRRTGGRRVDPDTEALLEIARAAVKENDRLTRKVVAQAIRGQQIPLSSDTLTGLMVQLREQRDRPATTSQD